MKVHSSLIIFFVALIAVTTHCRGQTVEANERGLWNLWITGTNSAFQASEVAALCQQFKAAAPRDPLVVVVSGFEAWHHLKHNKHDEAIKIFNSMLVEREPATPLQRAADKMARGWLTRLEREQVVTALKRIYRLKIEFPASLEELKTLADTPLPPLTDHWGKPWDYRLESSIKGMESQRYVLESSTLGPHSNLKKVLALPYADGLKLTPVRLVAGVKETVEFKTNDGQSAFRQLGSESSRITLAYLGSNILVLTDGNHWSVVAKPR
ncbi:MAG: hypothetical protein PHO37_10775 [Kiritimatiellae bacterium]|nr:hypothetical protein [Kiritimatiellia bacterium]